MMSSAIGTVVALQYLLIVVRVTSALITMPVFGMRAIPLHGRIGLGLATSLVLLPVSPIAGPIRPDPSFLTLVISEALLGLATGLTLAFVFAAVQGAASLLDVQVGFSLGMAYDPLFANATAVLERYYSTFATLVFLQFDGHHLALVGIQRLLTHVPVGQPLTLGSPDRLIDLSAAILVTALRIALPALGALLLADVAMGIVGRAMPQLNLLALALPLKTALGLVVVGYGMPVLATRLVELFNRVPFEYGWLVAR